MICSTCGQIESLETLDPMRAHYLKVGLRRAQAAMYGLDENGNPKLPKDESLPESKEDIEGNRAGFSRQAEAEEWEELVEIDKKLLKRKRQSRRVQGKYKGRGKTKTRDAS